MYKLCQEFKWTPNIINSLEAKDIETLAYIYNEIENFNKFLEEIGADEESTTILIE